MSSVAHGESIPFPVIEEASLKKSTFFGNFAAWVAVAAACIAFLAWYHMSDQTAVLAAVESSSLVQLGVMLASPVLLYAMGAVIGLLVVWFKKIEIGRGFRTLWRVVSAICMAFIVLAALPVFFEGLGGAMMGPVVALIIIARVGPILLMMLGFFYALAIAPVNKSKKSRLEKYLPDDHFE